MVKTINMLKNELKDYANVNMKIKSMCDKNELYPLVSKKGIYETDASVNGYCLAMCIVPNSYLSFEFALSWHGLIPEAVYTFTSASYKKRKKKKYSNFFGTYTFRDVPAEAFPYEVKIYEENQYYYRLASPEKALCDELYSIRPCKNKKELELVLFDDLRIEEDAFYNLNFKTLNELADLYHSTNLKLLKNYIRKDLDKDE